MPEKVDAGVARRRARELRAVAGQLQRRFQAAAIGTIRPALVLDDRGTALTDNYLKVQLREPAIRNRLVDVRVESAELGRVTGRVV
jgi:tRNA A37 methylthiotransferase MiaB